MKGAADYSQPGILAEVPSAGRYLIFRLIEATQARDALQALQRLANGEQCLVGLSEALVEALDANIAGLRAFPSLTSAGITIPTSAGDLWCWFRGQDRGELFLLSQRVIELVSPAFELQQAIDAFRFDVGRDLTGYEDGTENPKNEDAIEAAIVSGRGRGMDGSSFVAVQQWEHNLKRFNAMSPAEQDNAMGRRRSDNEELEDAPESAHVKRTAQESFTPEAFVLRRSMPWTQGAASGLVFVAFGKSFDAFEVQMRRMVGLDDGIADALFKFTRPLTGNYFWCPPIRGGKLDLSAIGLP